MPDGDVTVEFVGADAAMDDLRRWADQLGPAVVAKSRTTAEQVASRTSDRVPVDTGALAGSVAVAEQPDGYSVTEGEGLGYAGWIEFGGSRGRPYIAEGRYLYPTALEAEPEFQAAAEDTADDTIRGFSWSTPPS